MEINILAEELSRKAKSLSQAGNHNEVINLLSPHWRENRSNPMLGYYLATSYNRVGKPHQAYEVAQSVLTEHPLFEEIVSPYLFACYKVMVEPFRDPEATPDFETLEANVQKLMKISESRPTEFFRTKSILCLAGIYIKHNHAQKALDYLALINPFTLDKKRYTFPNKNQKQVILQSDFEKYYGFKAKAYESQCLWEECKTVCEEALKQGVTDVWLKRRHALANIKTGNTTQGLDELSSLSAQRKEWFIFIDLAEAYESFNNMEQAVQYVVTGLIRGSGGSHDEFIVRGLALAARYFRERGNDEYADLHLAYEIQIRLAKNWQLTDEMAESASQAALSIDPIEDLSSLLKQLSAVWYEVLGIAQNIVKGRITKIPDGKKYGFIRGEDSVDYFFLFSEFYDNPIKLKSGLPVKFQGKKGFDPVKKRNTIEALKIKPDE